MTKNFSLTVFLTRAEDRFELESHLESLPDLEGLGGGCLHMSEGAINFIARFLIPQNQGDQVTFFVVKGIRPTRFYWAQRIKEVCAGSILPRPEKPDGGSVYWAGKTYTLYDVDELAKDIYDPGQSGCAGAVFVGIIGLIARLASFLLLLGYDEQYRSHNWDR